MKSSRPILGVTAAVLLAAAALSGPTGCPGSNFSAPPNAANHGGTNASPEVLEFRNACVELQKRPELDLDEVTVQYVLIGVNIEGLDASKPGLSLAESELLAVSVWQSARRGDDFDKLVLTYSYGRLVSGQRPGMFTLLRGISPDTLLMRGPSTFRREGEEDALWRAAWRLAPGEIGGVEKHEKDANSGYYIVRRLTDAELARDNPANAPAASELIAQMRADAATLLARPEHKAPRVKVQHILIGRYLSDPAGRHKRLSPEQAEQLAAEVWQRVKDGEDFSALVREFTYDQAEGDIPGAYQMVLEKEGRRAYETPRNGMIPAFGDAAWRLEVGETGVVLYDRAKCFYGYHIIKRLEAD